MRYVQTALGVPIYKPFGMSGGGLHASNELAWIDIFAFMTRLLKIILLLCHLAEYFKKLMLLYLILNVFFFI